MSFKTTEKQQNQFINIFCREIQNTRYWSEFKDYQRLIQSFQQAIRMGGKFSQELSLICTIILIITTILKIFSYKYSFCKIQKGILDIYFTVVSLTILLMQIYPIHSIICPIPQPNCKEEQLNIPDKINDASDIFTSVSDFILQNQYSSQRRGSLTPITATFTNQIDSYIYLNDVLFVQQRPILLVHVLRQFIIIYQFTSIFSGQLLYEHLVAGAQLTFAILIQMQIDISLQWSDECSRQKDIQVMKTIHDLKNPVIAISQTINEEEYDTIDKDKMKKIINTELTELEDMLEGLRTEFKSRHQMEIQEIPNLVDSFEFAVQFKRAFKKLAQNGGNSLKIQSDDDFPVSICIQKSNVKRIVNNLISNALKHTMDGQVNVNLRVIGNEKIMSIFSENDPDRQMEPKKFKLDTCNVENYILIEVIDNGTGIIKEKLAKIFSEKYSDESSTNWDGTGLGLPICSQICSKINAVILYKSNPKVQTIFQFYIPNQHTQKLSISSTNTSPNSLGEKKKISIRLSVKILDRTSRDNDHNCNCAQFAEDNPNILSKQEKILRKRDIPFKTFENGRLLQNQINNMTCIKCQEILVQTDLNMPYMDGKELAQELRKLELSSFNRIKIILISAEEQDNSLNLFDEVFYKPINPGKLVNVYNEFFNVQTKIINHDRKTSFNSNVNLDRKIKRKKQFSKTNTEKLDDTLNITPINTNLIDKNF